MIVKFGVKVLSMLSALALAVVFVPGCTEETPPEPAKPAPGVTAPKPATPDKGAMAPAPAPTKEEPKK